MHGTSSRSRTVSNQLQLTKRTDPARRFGRSVPSWDLKAEALSSATGRRKPLLLTLPCYFVVGFLATRRGSPDGFHACRVGALYPTSSRNRGSALTSRMVSTGGVMRLSLGLQKAKGKLLGKTHTRRACWCPSPLNLTSSIPH